MNKKCLTCNVDFEPEHYNSKYCTVSCRNKNARLLRKDKIKEYNKVYYYKNREYFKTHWEKYYENNKDKVLVASRERYHKYKKQSYEYIRGINTRAKNKQRFGVQDKSTVMKIECEVCNSTEKLHIHHIDHNGRNSKIPNNVIENLMTICSSCHAKHHLHKMKV